MSVYITQYKQNMILLKPYIRYATIGFILGMLGSVLFTAGLIPAPNWVSFIFTIMAFSSVVIYLIGLTKYAKCPACGKLPRTNDNKLALNAKKCSHCGEVLS